MKGKIKVPSRYNYIYKGKDSINFPHRGSGDAGAKCPHKGERVGLEGGFIKTELRAFMF